MTAIDYSKWVMASGLEGPTREEALLGGGRLAEFITLGSVPDLDERALAGVDFLFDQIRALFIVPALETESDEAFDALWESVSARTLRLMDAVTVLLYEAGRATHSALTSRRLAHADRHAILEATSAIQDSARGQDLLKSLSLIEQARAGLLGFRDRAMATGDAVEQDLVFLIKGFHQGTLVWSLGALLCIEIAGRLSQLTPEPVRAGLVEKALDYTNAGAVLAAIFVASIAGLEFIGTPSAEDSIEDLDVADFLLRATTQVPRFFGPGVRFALAPFRYPDEPEYFEYHLVIETHVEPDRAIAALDELCEQWWDEAAADLAHDIVPVLGVIRNG